MKYKVGDKVKIRKDLQEGKRYDMQNEIKTSNSTTSYMCSLGGRTMTIKSVNYGQYQLLEDIESKNWTDGMFECSYYNQVPIVNSPQNIERVTFNNPATIIHFTDGTKTIVKATENDKYNPTVGFLYAYFEKMSGMSKTQCGKFFDSLEEEYAEQLERKMKKRNKKNK